MFQAMIFVEMISIPEISDAPLPGAEVLTAESRKDSLDRPSVQ